MQLKFKHGGHHGPPAQHRGRPSIARANIGHNDDVAADIPRKELFARFMGELRKEMQAARVEEARLLQADQMHISRGGNLRKTPSGTDYIFWGKIGQGSVPDLLNRIEDEIQKCQEPVAVSRNDFSTRYRFGRWLLHKGHITRDDMDEEGMVVVKSA